MRLERFDGRLIPQNVRLARAYTGREVVALCADYPFLSYDDWAICTTPMDARIPQDLSVGPLCCRRGGLRLATGLAPPLALRCSGEGPLLQSGRTAQLGTAS